MKIDRMTLTKEQKSWCASLFITKAFTNSQTNKNKKPYFRKALSFLDDREEIEKFSKMIKEGTIPGITKPDGISYYSLAMLFTELMVISTISNISTVQEMEFFTALGTTFGFSDTYIRYLMRWADKGLQWKFQRFPLIRNSHLETLETGSPDQFSIQFFSEKAEIYFLIDTSSLTEDKLLFFAKSILAMVRSDERITEQQTEAIRNAFAMLKSESAKNKLNDFFRSPDLLPLLTPTEKINKYLRAAIFTEMITVALSDGNFNSMEKEFLKNVSIKFNFTPSYSRDLMRWADDGYSWRKEREKLVKMALHMDENLEKEKEKEKMEQVKTV